MKTISFQPQQKEATNAINNTFKDCDRCLVKMFCGTIKCAWGDFY